MRDLIRRVSGLQGLGQDVRFAARMLWKTPLVSTIAAMSLALGIGTNTAIFSLADRLLWRALPVRDPRPARSDH